MAQGIHCFPKNERLTSKKSVETLFRKRVACFTFPFRAVWMESTEADAPAIRVLVSAPKKKFKHAVDRNRIKRLMRESYRLNKELLRVPEGRKVAIAFNYVATDIREFAYMQRKMKELFVQLNKEFTALTADEGND